MNKYGVPAVPYSESRGVIEGIMVTHPSSLNNDLKKNPDLLKNLKVFLSDEGHHLQADTWNRLLKSAPGIEFSIAMSASVINPARIPVTELNHLDYGEALVIGDTVNIIMFLFLVTISCAVVGLPHLRPKRPRCGAVSAVTGL